MIHKLETDALKNEIDDLMTGMLQLGEGLNNNKSLRGSKDSKKDKKNSEK